MGSCTSTPKETTKVDVPAANAWEIMIQSHQALYVLLDRLKAKTETSKHESMAEIRKEADHLFLLMKLHARIEDAVYFPVFNDFRPNIAGSFSQDHKNSAEGRPKLLELLNNGANSEVDFNAAMEALKKFCIGNRAHQEKEETTLDPFKQLFKDAKVKDLFLKIAELDFESFSAIYVPGIYAHIPTDAGKQNFLKALEYVLSATQYEAIKSHLPMHATTAHNATFVSNPSTQVPVVETPVKAWEIMIQSHQSLFKALDDLKLMTETMNKESMAEIRKAADKLFIFMD
jgi:hypothetical protein